MFVGRVPPDTAYLWIQGTSVLLPLMPSANYRPRVLLFGGSQPLIADLQPLVSTLDSGSLTWNDGSIFNLVHWVATVPRTLAGSPERSYCNAVILPTGEIFLCGGVQQRAASQDPCSGGPTDPGTVLPLDVGGVLSGEIYRPSHAGDLVSDDWVWDSTPPAGVVRNYHSVALLMPDGRVWTAGSSKNHCLGIANAELRIEIYEPDYIRDPDRPVITASPRTTGFGTKFSVETTQADRIARVAILRAASVTHGFSSDQRYVGLEFRAENQGRLTVSSPPTANIAPPGPYLLFVVNTNNIPSEGRFIHVWESWYAIGPPGIASASEPATILWNASNLNHLDAFVVANDGTVFSCFWEPERSWVPWFPIRPPGTASPTQPVTALWNASNPNHLDVFVVGNDGTVRSSYWEPQTSWVAWFSISPAGTANPKQPVRVLWNAGNPNHLDAFVVGNDGTVLSSYWEPQTRWVSWFAISPAGTANPNQGVSVLWNASNPNHLDAFVVGNDGTILSSYWEPQTRWVRWFPISPPGTAASPVSVLWNASNPNHLDAFVVRSDGTVLSSYWEPETRWVSWFAISPPDTAFPFQPVTALWSRNNPNHLDVFVISANRTVVSSYWEPAKRWAPWFAIGQPPGQPLARRGVAAAWSHHESNHLDIFVIGRDGTVWSNWWSDFISGW